MCSLGWNLCIYAEFHHIHFQIDLQSQTEYNKSAITDHMICTNHVIDLEDSRILDKESDIRTRLIKDAIHIRLHKSAMTRDAF